MGSFSIKYSYPVNDEWEFFTMLTRLNLDDELKNDVYNGKGFIISSPQTLKKDLKNPDGIFSSRFGPGMGELNTYQNRYSCKCGFLKGKINAGLGIECPNCHEPVKFVGDDYEMFGYIPLKEHYIIHPNLYKSLEFFFGQSEKSEKSDKKTNDKYKKTKLYNMINYAGRLDQDGHELPVENFPPDQPYYGIGMIDFYEKFDEIMQYYLNKYPKKKEYYDDIMENRDKVFIQSIPVFTTHLRPTDIKEDSMYFEPINGMYNMMNVLAHKINNNRTRMARKKKPKNQLLLDLQMKYMELYAEIEAILSGKKGKLRGLIGGQHPALAS